MDGRATLTPILSPRWGERESGAQPARMFLSRMMAPHFATSRPSVARRVTLRQLLNHTPGWLGEYLEDMGPGDDALSLMLAGELHYLFPVDPARSRVEPYAGAGLGLSHVNFDSEGRDDDSTEIALLLAGGVDVPVQRWWGWFGEVRFQIADESLFRLEGGINWKL